MTKNIGFHLIDQLVYMSGTYMCIHITSVWRRTTFFQTHFFFGKETLTLKVLFLLTVCAGHVPHPNLYSGDKTAVEGDASHHCQTARAGAHHRRELLHERASQVS